MIVIMRAVLTCRCFIDAVKEAESPWRSLELRPPGGDGVRPQQLQQEQPRHRLEEQAKAVEVVTSPTPSKTWTTPSPPLAPLLANCHRHHRYSAVFFVPVTCVDNDSSSNTIRTTYQILSKTYFAIRFFITVVFIT